MDIFMDKLAQRATAQEIIKANTAADVEELNKLKNQIEEYNECLARLKKLIDNGTAKLENMQAEDAGIKSLAEEELEGIKNLRHMVESLGQNQKKIAEQMKSMDESLELASRSLEDRIDSISGVTEEQLAERLSAVEENVHKECVKVYRNVQAVVTEESGKQSETAAEMKTGISSFKGKLNMILGISIMALVISLAGIVFQILARMGVLPF